MEEKLKSKNEKLVIREIEKDNLFNYVKDFELLDYSEMLKYNRNENCLGNRGKKTLYSVSRYYELGYPPTKEQFEKMLNIYIKFLNSNYIEGFNYEDFKKGKNKRKKKIDEEVIETMEIEEKDNKIYDFSDILF